MFNTDFEESLKNVGRQELLERYLKLRSERFDMLLLAQDWRERAINLSWFMGLVGVMWISLESVPFSWRGYVIFGVIGVFIFAYGIFNTYERERKYWEPWKHKLMTDI